MADKRYLMGLFKDEHAAVAAIEAIGHSSFQVERVHSPIPSHRLLDAVKAKTSRVGYCTLAGGIIGFFTGFLLAIFTATRWDLIVSGKPIISLIPFFIVGFEFTILFAIFGNLIGFLFMTDIPKFDWAEHYDDRCSGEHFGVLATCDPREEGELQALFVREGGEVRQFDH